MDSFYGGHQGTPFIIKHAFKSISKMKEEFKKGIRYKDVWFGEYCIIDTESKLDPDNGKIFRRGTEYTKDNGDAVYIGQIVGPSGPAPLINIKTVNQVTEEIGNHPTGTNKEYQIYPYKDEDDNDNIKPYYDNAESTTDPDPYVYESDNSWFVPGYVPPSAPGGTAIENKSIKFVWCNIKKHSVNGEPDITNDLLLGFEIPYTVFSIKPTFKSPYNDEGERIEPQNPGSYIPIEPVPVEEGEEINPFHRLLELTSYQGAPGISYIDFSVVSGIVADCNVEVYNPDQLEYHPSGNPCLKLKEGADPVSLSFTGGKRYYVARVCAFDSYNNPKSSWCINSEGKFEDVVISETEQKDGRYDYDSDTRNVRSIWLLLGEYNQGTGEGYFLLLDENNEQIEQFNIKNGSKVIKYKKLSISSTSNEASVWWGADGVTSIFNLENG